MAKMLTAKEIQDVLGVDRSTVYRMAEDGRLPAFKVGRQWRFPADEIDAWLNTQKDSSLSPFLTLPEQTDPVYEAFPLDCIQIVQDTFAEALGVMVIITDMDGKPLTQFSNACGLFSAMGDNMVFWDKCMAHWQEMAGSLSLEPQYLESYLGLLCSRAFIRSGNELKGMVFVGGIAPENWPPPAAKLDAIADDLEIDSRLLSERVEDVYVLSAAQKAHVLALVQKIAGVVSHILHERSRLMT